MTQIKKYEGEITKETKDRNHKFSLWVSIRHKLKNMTVRKIKNITARIR